MNSFFEPAQTTRHILVHFHNNMLCRLTDGHQMRRIGTKIKISVIVHRSNHQHCHIIRLNIFPIITRQFRITNRAVVRTSSGNQLALVATHMPGIPAEMLPCIFTFKDGQRLQHDTATHLHIPQLIRPTRQCRIQCIRCPGTPAIVYPVSRLDYLHCLIC